MLEMKNTAVLVDTNILLDAFLQREPYTEDSQKIIEKCAKGELTGYLAAHSIPNIFYVLRKDYTQEERRRFIKNLCAIFSVSPLDSKKLMAAAERIEFADYEDCLQEECAAEIEAAYIITRNPNDYKVSRINAVTPTELLQLMQENEEQS